jgi:phosphate transport system substrate-binding protein
VNTAAEYPVLEDDTVSPSASLTGIGSSSIEPLYGQVFYQYNKANSGVSVNYSDTGSGPGVTAIQQNTANFGQSETPMTSSQLAAATKGTVLQIPVDLGGVAISYNVPGLPNGLKLNGTVLAGIYLGTITNWNDPSIAALNPGVSLPSLTIIPVRRSDTSGPGYDLDQYLIDTSSAWTSAIGTTAASTKWPVTNVGTGQQLNAGVATYIAQTQGAIGYVEYAYAKQANFDNAALASGAGTYVSPSESTFATTGANASNLSATNFNVINSGSGYPLVNFSWALVYQKQSNTNAGLALGKVLYWAVTTGQQYAANLGYAPLPANAVALAKSTLLQLQNSGGQVLFTS